MMVRAAISQGFDGSALAFLMAAEICAGSWPSMAIVFQFEASKRFSWSSDTERFVAPSIEIELSSQKTMSLPSFKCPASEIASWLMPSMRQPSPAIT